MITKFLMDNKFTKKNGSINLLKIDEDKCLFLFNKGREEITKCEKFLATNSYSLEYFIHFLEVNSLVDYIGSIIKVSSTLEPAISKTNLLSKLLELNDLFIHKHINNKEFLSNLQKNIPKMELEYKKAFRMFLKQHKVPRINKLKIIQINKLVKRNLILNQKSTNNLIKDYDRPFKISVNNDFSGLSKTFLGKAKKKSGFYWFSFYDAKFIMENCHNEKVREIAYNAYENLGKNNDLISRKIRNNLNNIAKLKGKKNFFELQKNQLFIQSSKQLETMYKKIYQWIKKDYDTDLNHMNFFAKEWKHPTSVCKHNYFYLRNLYFKNVLNIKESEIEKKLSKKNVLLMVKYAYKKYFNLDIVKIKSEKGIETFAVKQKNQILGYIYGDLVAYQGKQSGFSIDVIVPKYDNNPTHIFMSSELSQSSNRIDDVVSFFHEFGHILSEVLSLNKTPFLNGLSIKEDYTEFSSQFFEKFFYREDVLFKVFKNKQDKKNVLKILHLKKDFTSYEKMLHLQIAILDTDLYTKPNKSFDKCLKTANLRFPLLDDRMINHHYFNDHLYDESYAACYYQYILGNYYSSMIYEKLSEKDFDPKKMNKFIHDCYNHFSINNCDKMLKKHSL